MLYIIHREFRSAILKYSRVISAGQIDIHMTHAQKRPYHKAPLQNYTRVMYGIIWSNYIQNSVEKPVQKGP